MSLPGYLCDQFLEEDVDNRTGAHSSNEEGGGAQFQTAVK